MMKVLSPTLAGCAFVLLIPCKATAQKLAASNPEKAFAQSVLNTENSAFAGYTLTSTDFQNDQEEGGFTSSIDANEQYRYDLAAVAGVNDIVSIGFQHVRVDTDFRLVSDDPNAVTQKIESIQRGSLLFLGAKLGRFSLAAGYEMLNQELRVSSAAGGSTAEAYSSTNRPRLDAGGYFSNHALSLSYSPRFSQQQSNFAVSEPRSLSVQYLYALSDHDTLGLNLTHSANGDLSDEEKDRLSQTLVYERAMNESLRLFGSLNHEPAAYKEYENADLSNLQSIAISAGAQNTIFRGYFMSFNARWRSSETVTYTLDQNGSSEKNTLSFDQYDFFLAFGTEN